MENIFVTLKIIGKTVLTFHLYFTFSQNYPEFNNLKLALRFFLTSSDRLRACGGVLSRNLTHLQSPSYPGTYTPDSTVSCAYTFTKVSS